MFCLSIHLWVICSSGCEFYSQESVQLSSELCNKLWPPIQDDLLQKSMMLPYMSEIDSGCSECCDFSICGDKVGSLTDQVHHIHHCIIPIGLWEFNNEFNIDGVPPVLQDWEWD